MGTWSSSFNGVNTFELLESQRGSRILALPLVSSNDTCVVALIFLRLPRVSLPVFLLLVFLDAGVASTMLESALSKKVIFLRTDLGSTFSSRSSSLSSTVLLTLITRLASLAGTCLNSSVLVSLKSLMILS